MTSSISIAPNSEACELSAACNFNEKDYRSGNCKPGLAQVAYREGDDDDDGGYDYAPAA
ncbi:unnamed protein product [Lathyrus sativus]|nr:unnamed protein product [Lathyrus sativus]